MIDSPVIGRLLDWLLDRDGLGYAPGHRTKRIPLAGGWHRCECGTLLATGYLDYWRHQRDHGHAPPGTPFHQEGSP